jgi:hypothetical protein
VWEESVPIRSSATQKSHHNSPGLTSQLPRPGNSCPHCNVSSGHAHVHYNVATGTGARRGEGKTENTLNTGGLGVAYPLPLNTRSRLAGKWGIERWAERGGFLFSRTRPLIGFPPRHGQRSHVTAPVPVGGLGGRLCSSGRGETRDREEKTLNNWGLAYPLPLNTWSCLAGKWGIERWAGRGDFLFSRTRPLIGFPSHHGQRSHVTAPVPVGGLGGRSCLSGGGETRDGEENTLNTGGLGVAYPLPLNTWFRLAGKWGIER